ncbi:MAG: hypothetical protein DK304_001389 [Chloroflexi bacterium]|jgi:hypothetical protein|nr:MAG: hypothetical protein DK304_001389 [Chloroflexota bacterium]
MSQEVLRDIIDKAVADYGFRLAVMHGVDDVIAASDLSDAEATALRGKIVPELKTLPDPVEPADRPSVQSKLADLSSET